MPVCWYYQQGRCRFGDRCRYEHPRERELRYEGRDIHHGGGANNSYSRYHWSNSNNGAEAQSMRSRAAAFDFNAALEQARAKEISVWNRGGGDNPTSSWRTRDIQNYSADRRDYARERAYVDRSPEERRPSRPSSREEYPRRWGHGATGGSVGAAAAAFDFNRTLETVRQREARRYQDEDLDMASVEDFHMENRWPGAVGGSGAFGESSRSAERWSAPTISGPSQTPFMFGHLPRSDSQQGHSHQAYSQSSYPQQSYSQTSYSHQGYSQPSYSQQGRSQPSYSQQGHIQGYSQPSSSQRGYSHPSTSQQSYSHPSTSQQSYSHPSTSQQSYSQPSSSSQQGYPRQNYSQPGCSQQSYPQPSYSQQAHAQPGPSWQSYSHQSQPEQGHRTLGALGETARKADHGSTSDMEIDADAREQYLAENFTLGRIPVDPPPPKYCR